MTHFLSTAAQPHTRFSFSTASLYSISPPLGSVSLCCSRGRLLSRECLFSLLHFVLQRFRFMGLQDCPDWLLAEIVVLAKLTSVKQKMLVAGVIKDMCGIPLDYAKVAKWYVMCVLFFFFFFSFLFFLLPMN